jgi:hypothetical protein
MKLKVKISKEEFKSIEEKLENGVEIEFYDGNNMRMEKWVITCEIVTKELFEEEEIELNETMAEESDNNPENKSIDSNLEFNTEKDENNESSDKTDDDDIMNENNENKNGSDNDNMLIKNNKVQKLIEELNNEKEIMEDHDMDKNTSKLSLRQLYIRIQIHKGKVREDYYDIGKEFKERLEEGLCKYSRRSNKNEKDVREKLYDEMLGHKRKGRERDNLKESTRNAVKIYELFKEVGKDRMMKTVWKYRTIERCNKHDIIEVIEYFKNIDNQR